MNQFKKNIEVPTEGSHKKVHLADETIKKASDFSFFIKKEKLNEWLLPIFMFVVVVVFYVALSHYHVKSIKHQDDLKKEINELRSEYISVKSMLMKKSNQTEVSKRLEEEQIKELITPPIVIKPNKK